MLNDTYAVTDLNFLNADTLIKFGLAQSVEYIKLEVAGSNPNESFLCFFFFFFFFFYYCHSKLLESGL